MKTFDVKPSVRLRVAKPERLREQIAYPGDSIELSVSVVVPVELIESDGFDRAITALVADRMNRVLDSIEVRY